MKILHKCLFISFMVVLLVSLTGCNSLSQRDRNVIIGAGVGAVSGSILTGGSSVGTVGGAALGGYIGHEVSR